MTKPTFMEKLRKEIDTIMAEIDLLAGRQVRGRS